MQDLKHYTKYWYVPVLCLCCAVFLLVFKGRSPAKEVAIPNISTQDSIETPVKNYIFVDISGAVNKPGFYELAEGSRVVDLIKVADGFSSQAHVGFVSQKLNLAEKLKDGEKLYIPFVFDENITALTEELSTKCFESVNSAKDPTESPSGGDTVDVNTASKDALIALPGIGEVTADKIINGRPYATIEDFYTFIKFSTTAKASLEGILIAK